MRSEHTIGQLKGHFQSLRGIFTVISGKDTHTLVVLWIQTCIVLHNLLLEDGYDSNWESAIEDPDIIGTNDTSKLEHSLLPYNDTIAKRKRELIKAQVLNYHDGV